MKSENLGRYTEIRHSANHIRPYCERFIKSNKYISLNHNSVAR